jgi:hypothetical protein
MAISLPFSFRNVASAISFSPSNQWAYPYDKKISTRERSGSQVYNSQTEDGRCETNARFKFDRMLDAGAFESAAMTLVPEGHGGSFTFFKDGTAKAFVWQPYPLAIEVRAATITLALCAAALRARATTEPTP